MTERAAVLFVNQAFYEAFRARDMETIDQLWAREAPVACIHPGWRALTTRTEVMDSWRDILASEGVPDIACRGAQAFLAGEHAIVICYEVIGGGVLVATNIFRKEAGSWRMMHHQAGPCDLPTQALDDDEDDDLSEENAMQ
jgi:ketosteroid isomerase-like protein